MIDPTVSWLERVSSEAGVELWPEPIEARRVVTADGATMLVVGPLRAASRPAVGEGLREALERFREISSDAIPGNVLREALEREPTLAEVRQYGMDGSSGTNFNTLQWRLDLVRAALAADKGSRVQPHSVFCITERKTS